MKKTIFILLSLVLVAVLANMLLPIRYGSMESAYNPITRLISCSNADLCLHEIGHKVDQEAGWVSRTDEFRYTVQAYRDIAFSNPEMRDEITVKILFFDGIGKKLKESNDGIFSTSFWMGGWGGYTELYAEILRLSDGDKNKVPAPFVKFYDWDKVDELVKAHIR